MSPRPGDVIGLREATRAWFAISLQTFGGPAGQIAVMQHKLVDEKRWIGQQRFLHALNYCMLLPGPEAQQLAIYTGWLLNGTLGGLIAGVLFVLPGLVAMLALSAVYVGVGDTTLITALFAGLAPAVIAIVVHAVRRIGARALPSPPHVLIAVASFLALAVVGISFPLVILGAGVIGWLLWRHRPPLPAADASDGPAPLISDEALHHEPPTPARSARVLAIGLVLWAIPLIAVGLLVGSTDVFRDQGLFFSGTAVVTFGGAYAVLSYVAQQAVHVYGWLTPSEMIKGLALAETTPGPLIMVVQFVAFLGAYRDPGSLNPWVAAVLASLLVCWVTFVPCFVFVFLGAPYVERLRHNQSLSAALTGVTAAVVGVIANLAFFFALHALFDDVDRIGASRFHLDVPVWSTVDWFAVALTCLALAATVVRGWSPLKVLGLCGAIGLLHGVMG